MPTPSLSVIVRARDEAAGLGRCLELVRAQDRPAELIVVDHASRDGTAELARAHGATVLPLAADAFSFGGALNLGAGRATGEILVALSAHAFAHDPAWLSRLVAALDDATVACASGERFLPSGEPLTAPVRVDAASLAAHPSFGYSNAAGAFRAELWREHPFRTDLPACEDKAWAAHWAASGYVTVLDPALLVEHDHTHDPVRDIFRRARREAVGMGMIWPGPAGPGREGTPPSEGGGALRSEWWSDTRFYASPWRARLSHRRAARILGTRAGVRDAASGRTAPGRPAGGPG